ncbi:MAG: hypothetical protein R3247_11030, partial [Rhodothermales bacterium]|nr:hypothetical protein [Rhodothermales bacterium]
MSSFWERTNGTVEREEYLLDALSDQLQISMQTLVRWADRHLIDAELDWSLNDDNEEIRVIRLRTGKLDEIRTFA